MNKCLLVLISTNSLCFIKKLIVSATSHGKFCLWALTVAIHMSVAFCQLATCNFSEFGKMSNERGKEETVKVLIILGH